MPPLPRSRATLVLSGVALAILTNLVVCILDFYAVSYVFFTLIAAGRNVCALMPCDIGAGLQLVLLSMLAFAIGAVISTVTVVVAVGRRPSWGQLIAAALFSSATVHALAVVTLSAFLASGPLARGA